MVPGPRPAVTILVVAGAGFVASLALTGVVRRLALSRSLIDWPNERSSHTRPTPRGGGLGPVLVILVGSALLGAWGGLPPRVACALVGGGSLIALVGWLDDRRSLGIATRLAAHVLAAGWAMWWLGGVPTLTVGESAVRLGPLGVVLGGATIVWAVNVTNFMDGIDGLAAGETATVSLTAALLLLAAGDVPLATAAALTGASALGFLVWNWQPARIFLGDVGSGFLGFVLAVLAIASERAGSVPALVWLLLYAAFAVDATSTLVRRALRGERWYAPHRSHAYQRAVQAGWSHARVSASVIGFNLGLGGLAWLATREPGWLWPLLLAGVVVCAFAYLWVERMRPMGHRGG